MFLTIIGDIHGCEKTFKALLNRLPKPLGRVVLIGDLINKGPSSYQAFEFYKQQGFEMVLGNHEYLMIKRFQNREIGSLWLEKGGIETIESIMQAIPLSYIGKVTPVLAEHLAFSFGALPSYLFVPIDSGRNILLSHAGISQQLYDRHNGNVLNCLQEPLKSPDSVLFNKLPLANIPGIMQVIGHQPTMFAPKLIGSNYYIDSGCVYKKPGMGYLSALRFDLENGTPPVIYKQVRLDHATVS